MITFKNDHACLSNFWPVTVTVNGILFPSVEHAFQACKTFDLEWKEKIRTASTPGKAKRLGRAALLRIDWDDIKIDVMEGLVRQKLTALPDIQELLLETGSEVIAELNDWGDTFWGMTVDDDWVLTGRNELGKIWMKLRGELQGKNAKIVYIASVIYQGQMLLTGVNSTYELAKQSASNVASVLPDGVVKVHRVELDAEAFPTEMTEEDPS